MILPLKAFAFQLLFILVAITVEGMVLHRQLKLQRRASMQYSASLNLFSTVFGWLIFFAIVALLSNFSGGILKQQLISYILFNQFFSEIWQQGMNTLLVVLALLTFFGTFLVELNALFILETILGIHWDTGPSQADMLNSLNRYVPYQQPRHFQNRAYAILVANACSYSVILLILLIRQIS